MPLHESTELRVRVTVEVDGHTLEFEEVGAARGARYHGKGGENWSVLEHSIRTNTAEMLAKATERTAAFLVNAYPLAGDDRG